ncbi:MAG: hypothetical protein WBD55_11490 [Dehalococcoidia bacterium]
MRPNSEEILRGVQTSLLTYILPEVQRAYARTELMVVLSLLGIVAGEWDGAAQRLVDNNAALRDLARRGIDALGADHALADELRSLANEADPSLRIGDLAAANGRLRTSLAGLATHLAESDASDASAVRAAIIAHLRAEAEAQSRALMGPRADG